MSIQKQEIIEFVASQREKGVSIKKSLEGIGINKSSYYRWLKAPYKLKKEKMKVNSRMLTPLEKQRIEEVKAKNPELRHRRVQAALQGDGLYISATSVYRHLRAINMVEPYSRRPAPWDEPHYEVISRDFMWGADWTKLRVAGVRFYLLTLIDFYSRLIVAHNIVSTVTSSHIRDLYREGLENEGIPLNWTLPELRVDRGSPNTSRVTRCFFDEIGAELSWARVKRPTDNAITERFYGTIKQEEIYLVGDYPDLQSAKEEIAKYIEHYNNKRPHQALWNFTPQHIHELNDKTEVLKYLKKLKKESRENRKNYWRNEAE
jgi:putative transposase